MTDENNVPAPPRKPNAVPAKTVAEWKEAILSDPKYRTVKVDFLDQLLDIYAYDDGKLYGEVLEKYSKDKRKRAKEEAKQAIRDRKAEGLKNLDAEKNLSPEGKQDDAERLQPPSVQTESE